MPVLIPIILTATQMVLAADSVPKFDVERTCQPAAAKSGHSAIYSITSSMCGTHGR
jgi:hypothetical protein